MSTSSTNDTAGASPSLQAFNQAAQQSPQVCITVRDGQYALVNAASTAQVPSIDTTAVFLQTLRETFGNVMTGVVAKELGLAPSPGQPLDSATLRQAVDMAETARRAMLGVEFLSLLDHSEQAEHATYHAALKRAGIDPDSIGQTARQTMFQLMQMDEQVAPGSDASKVLPHPPTISLKPS